MITATKILSALMVILGVAMIVSTITRGGGPIATGLLLGALFIAAGGARLYLQREHDR